MNSHGTQDTTGSAAYVTRPGGPPDNSGYLIAAYGVTLALYGGYIVVLWRRMARARGAAMRDHARRT